MRHSNRTRTLTVGRDGRVKIMVSLDADEAKEVEAAASGLPVATWCRWAVLRTARFVRADPSGKVPS